LTITFFITQLKKHRHAKAQENNVKEIFKPLDKINSVLDSTRQSYKELQSSYQNKLRQLRSDEELLSLYELGVGTMDKVAYSSLVDTRDQKELELALTVVKEWIKEAVKSKTACVCHHGNNVVVNNRRSEAKKLFNREIKLRLRCLDNDVKSAIALAEWNNIDRLVKRIQNSYSEINSTGKIVKTFIQSEYLEMKIRELRLSYEIAQLKADLKEEEREERRRIREAEREELKIKEAADKAHKDRVRMENLIQQELEKLQDSNQEQRELLEQYKHELILLKEKESRAVSMAQLTRSGYVYVISNTMAFGDDICKIGMTRRVDPNERVHELGGASVPDLFTVHGFIFTEDAPKLENELHEIFASNRVNLVNKRKEFFYVQPSEVIEKIKELYPSLKVESEFLISGEDMKHMKEEIVIEV
jgi:hypothetical protein